ncbi:hypothetical protein [Aeromicrobium sp. Root236]|uniref:hypothetical protein n=1 Tax=Aeromicrobium sp. Root236 TaxID=1736498 RepID=UPI000ABC35D9|nr:hypothetical protein [Aeromicrobium sp. Root236]
MKSRCFRVVVSLVALTSLAACDGGSGGGPTPTSTQTTTQPPDVTEHESGPESPITYGLQVPRGATQLGPLIRYRSARLIAAYLPELKAAQAQKDAEARDKAAEEASEGTPTTPTTPTPDTRPSDDSFKLLDDPPKPDSTVSLMRIDGDPSDVVRRMLAQIAALLPDSGVSTDDLGNYCTSAQRRITRCRLAIQGIAQEDREIRVVMTVDPGKIATRTSGPSDLTRPVMTLSVEYVGEPRKGQLSRESNSLDGVKGIDSEPEKSGLIWPKMDEDAPATSKLLNGWTAPTTASILLSGYHPSFVVITAKRAVDADVAAEQYVLANSPNGRVSKDVVEDLNEVSTTYTTRTKNGGTARATYVLSARGNYSVLFYDPTSN